MQDLTGKKFNRLTVLELDRKEQKYTKTGKKDGHFYYWKCQCDCGKIITVWSGHLISGHTRSCGCQKIEELIQRRTTHGLSYTRLCATFRRMKQRCYNKNDKKYYCYGARGIKICDEWLKDPRNFYDWALSNGYKEDLSIDRIDVNGNYEPSNCRWADSIIQANNRTTNRYIEMDGEKLTLAQWCRKLNIKDHKFYKALKKTNSDLEALKLCL